MDWHGTQRLALHEGLGETKGLRGHPDGAWWRELLHARGQVRGLPDGRVIDAEVRANGADHNLSRVQPHSDPDRDAVSTERLIRVALHQLLHA